MVAGRVLTLGEHWVLLDERKRFGPRVSEPARVGSAMPRSRHGKAPGRMIVARPVGVDPDKELATEMRGRASNAREGDGSRRQSAAVRD